VQPGELGSPAEFGLVDGSVAADAIRTGATPSRRVLQFIEDTVYDWEEFDLLAEDGRAGRALRLRAPFAALLPAHDAALLLSASRKWRTLAGDTVGRMDGSAEERADPPVRDPAGDAGSSDTPARVQTGPDVELEPAR
jgi:hypothetical protein